MPGGRMKYKRVILGIVALLALAVTAIFGLRQLENFRYEMRVSVLIKRIENYRAVHHKLPATMAEMGLEDPMNEGPYYERKDSLRYTVFFNTGLDNDTKVYDSDTQQWRDEPEPDETHNWHPWNTGFPRRSE